MPGSRLELCTTETEGFGATHGSVGAYLLGLWRLPASIVEAAAFHPTPGKSNIREFGPLAAVHLADVLEGEQSKTAPMPSAGFDEEYLRSLNVQNRLDEWRVLFRKIAE